VRAATADGNMPAWEGRGTNLPAGFATLRMETNLLRVWVTERQPPAGPGSEALRDSTDPAQLLCRALRLAPACYRGFELAADQLDKPLEVLGHVSLPCGDAGSYAWHAATAEYHSIAELAAALQRFASAESVSVQLSPDEQSVIMRRSKQ